LYLTWNDAHDVVANVDVGFDGQRSGVHWAHALELLLAARVELLVHGGVSIYEQLDIGLDLAGDIGDTLNLEGQTAVAGRECDVEEGGREAGVGHARVERLGFDDALCRDEGCGDGSEP
jgi:hypothetical protein